MPVLANVIEQAFSPLISLFESIMVFLHAHVVGGSWGLAIVGLTVIVRAVMVPLTYRQLKSMQEMQRIAPQLQALKEKYKDDKQRQQQEMMKLYQEHGVNPFASCLPLLLQLPVFISLFYMLRTDLKLDICGPALHRYFHVPPGQPIPAKELAATGCNQVAPGSAKFLFIPDITAKATGIVLIVLILMYVGSQVASTLVATATADPNQRRLVLLLPLVFVAILYRYPAGLLVYWITSNTWTIGQQLLIRRHMGAAPAAPGGGARGGPGTGPSPNGKPDAPRGKPSPQPALAGVGSGGGTPSTPPRPPRKKKKRSGRRR
ncbi:MAG TPA: YidC/Oxa1 family membrane protein insertase [Solirubrobacteraceae bacterium]|nr:YidC/Oxa1 family membrane protein insertase [Solirubrobacteraceae bacterium]